MAKAHYSPSTRLSDILKDNFRRSNLLYLLDIKVDDDDTSSLEEVCRASHINLELFLHLCNIYTFEDYLPEENITGEFPVDPTIDYIITAHSFFTNENMPLVNQYYDDLQPVLSEKSNETTKTLYENFLAVLDEHISCVHSLFAKYRKRPRSVKPDQVEYVIAQEVKINAILDALIKQLNEMPVPEQFKVHVDQLRYYLTYLRGDFDKHNLIKNLVLNRLNN